LLTSSEHADKRKKRWRKRALNESSLQG